MSETVKLTGSDLTIDQLVRVVRPPYVRVVYSRKELTRVESARDLVNRAVKDYTNAWNRRVRGQNLPRDYGITTGFGEFKDKDIRPRDLERLQVNILLSHSAGVGENTDWDDPANYFSQEVVRGALLVRLNAFLKGYSGVRSRLVEIIQAMLNTGVIPLVPLRGSVGASGDLCPLSHLFVTLLGEGKFYRVGDRRIRPAKELIDVLREEIDSLTVQEMRPTFKEGLALTNGANFSAAMLALGVHDAIRLAEVADVAVAMTLEAVGGCTRAFDPKVHAARNHPEQAVSAGRVLNMLSKSKYVERSGAVQDIYSVRCAPQVHGASREAIKFVEAIAQREINAATDNPLLFPGGGPSVDIAFARNWPDEYNGRQRKAYSAGNFHGQPIALAADFLTIALAELANISERRTQMLLDGHHNRNLPENLIANPGVNSGFMIAQYTAASLVSENKVLAHPASVDSIPTSANTEDHVSMSTHAARKMRIVLGNAQAVLSTELMCATQALEWRTEFDIPATKLTDKQKLTYHPTTPRSAKGRERQFELRVVGNSKRISKKIAPALRSVYLAIREQVDPLVSDRMLHEDIAKIRALLETGVFTEQST